MILVLAANVYWALTVTEHFLSIYQTKYHQEKRGLVVRWRGGYETDNKSVRQPGRSRLLLADLRGCCNQSSPSGMGLARDTVRTTAPTVGPRTWHQSQDRKIFCIWSTWPVSERSGSVSLAHRPYLLLTFHGPEIKGWERKPGGKDETFTEHSLKSSVTSEHRFYLKGSKLRLGDGEQFSQGYKASKWPSQTRAQVLLTTSTQYTVFSKAYLSLPADLQPLSSCSSWWEAVCCVWAN